MMLWMKLTTDSAVNSLGQHREQVAKLPSLSKFPATGAGVALQKKPYQQNLESLLVSS